MYSSPEHEQQQDQPDLRPDPDELLSCNERHDPALSERETRSQVEGDRRHADAAGEAGQDRESHQDPPELEQELAVFQRINPPGAFDGLLDAGPGPHYHEIVPRSQDGIRAGRGHGFFAPHDRDHGDPRAAPNPSISNRPPHVRGILSNRQPVDDESLEFLLQLGQLLGDPGRPQ